MRPCKIQLHLAVEGYTLSVPQPILPSASTLIWDLRIFCEIMTYCSRCQK